MDLYLCQNETLMMRKNYGTRSKDTSNGCPMPKQLCTERDNVEKCNMMCA